MADVTRILAAIEAGDARAADALLPLVYDELRRLAAAQMAGEKPGQTLDATALVHEAWLRLVASGGRQPPESTATPQGADAPRSPGYRSRGHFLAAAATAMRRIRIDAARRRNAQKRGGGRRRLDLDAVAAPEPDDDLLALDEALTALAARDPLKARLVELRYFAGLTGDQTAELLGISPSAADRHWAFARAWLHARIRGA